MRRGPGHGGAGEEATASWPSAPATGLAAVFRDLGVRRRGLRRTDHEPLHREHSGGDRHRSRRRSSSSCPTTSNIIMAAQQCVAPDGEEGGGHPHQDRPPGHHRHDERRLRGADAQEDITARHDRRPQPPSPPPRSPTPPGTPTLTALPSSRGTIWPWRSGKLFGTDRDLDALLGPAGPRRATQDGRASSPSSTARMSPRSRPRGRAAIFAGRLPQGGDHRPLRRTARLLLYHLRGVRGKPGGAMLLPAFRLLRPLPLYATIMAALGPPLYFCIQEVSP